MQFHRGHVTHISFILVGVIFIVKLLFIQVLNDEYQYAAEKNIIQPVLEYPYRGVIYDRNGDFLTYNVPVYDLMVIPKEVKNLDVSAFCQDFSVDPLTFEHTLKKARAYSYFKPSVFIKNLSEENWAKIQSRLIEYPGFFVKVRTVRKYPLPMLAHTLGYMGEIDSKQLTTDAARSYRKGDMIGISGLEKTYEEVLRGHPGIRYQISNVKGINKGSFRGGALDQPPVPGQDIKTSIDATLQKYGEQLMKNKRGSIVVIIPQTGEVLALISSPSYDPNLLTGKDLGSHFYALEQNMFAPLFHRAIAAMYAPGSVFKLCQALIALQEKVVSTHTIYPCDRSLVSCHPHPSPLNLKEAIKYSCNPYFRVLFKKIINTRAVSDAYEDTCIGLVKWGSYLSKFGLGVTLGIDLPGEKRGHIPDVQFYDRLHGKGNWKASTIRSLDIGQGELLITPLQMANLVAIIANRGYYYTPHIVKQIGNQPVSLMEAPKKQEIAIDQAHFECIALAMQEGVESGTSWRARVKELAICAKTGTSENPHGEAHSMCVAFAPRENPQIALAVCVENSSWGSRAAASIAGLLIEKYLKGAISRPWIQDYVLKGNFFH